MIKVEIKLTEYADNGASEIPPKNTKLSETQMTRYYPGMYSYFIEDFSDDLAGFLQLVWGKELLKGEHGFFKTVTTDEFNILENAFQKIRAEKKSKKGEYKDDWRNKCN